MPRSRKEHEPLLPNETKVVDISRETAFNAFFREYNAALCFFAQSIIHDEEEARDIVQNCFIRLWDDETAFTKKGQSVKSFLYTMVKNRCIDHVRKEKVIKKAERYLQSHEEVFEYFDELAFAEMMRQVIAGIEELPGGVSSVIKQHFFEGKKLKQIAHEFSISADSAHMKKTRGLKLLKQRFSNLSDSVAVPALLLFILLS